MNILTLAKMKWKWIFYLYSCTIERLVWVAISANRTFLAHPYQFECNVKCTCMCMAVYSSYVSRTLFIIHLCAAFLFFSCDNYTNGLFFLSWWIEAIARIFLFPLVASHLSLFQIPKIHNKCVHVNKQYSMTILHISLLLWVLSTPNSLVCWSH